MSLPILIGACQGRERERGRDKETKREREHPRTQTVPHPHPANPHSPHASCTHLRCPRCSRTVASFASSAHTPSWTSQRSRKGEEMRGILSETGIKYYEELRTSTSTIHCPTSTRSPHNETNPHRRYQAPRRPMCARHILILVFSQGWSREVFPLPERRQRVEMRIMTEVTTATTTCTIAPPHHTGTSWHVGRRTAASIRVVSRCSRRRIRRQE